MGKYLWMNPPFGMAEEACELALWLQRRNLGTRVWLLLPERKRSHWWNKYVERSRGRRAPFSIELRLAPSTVAAPKFYFDYFGGDNWGGLDGREKVEFSAGSALRATGPWGFPLVVLGLGV